MQAYSVPSPGQGATYDQSKPPDLRGASRPPQKTSQKRTLSPEKAENLKWMRRIESKVDSEGSVNFEAETQDMYWGAAGAAAGGAAILLLSFMMLGTGSKEQAEDLISEKTHLEETAPGQVPTFSPDHSSPDHSTSSHSAPAQSSPPRFSPPHTLSISGGVQTQSNLSDHAKAPASEIDTTQFPTSRYVKDSDGNLFLEEYEYVPI